jgi:hypothetical protein
LLRILPLSNTLVQRANAGTERPTGFLNPRAYTIDPKYRQAGLSVTINFSLGAENYSTGKDFGKRNSAPLACQ